MKDRVPISLLWRCFIWVWLFGAGMVAAPTSLLAQTTSIRINFQDGATVPPDGYLRDSGEAFGPRDGTDQGEGLRYGWVVPYSDSPLAMTMVGRNRLAEGAAVADVRLATLMHMEHAPSGLRGHWQIALPNGTYRVTASVGDASFFTSQHWLNGNDQVLVAGFKPTETTPFLTVSHVVRVENGRLTLHDTGGDRTKINYVEIEAIDVSDRPAVTVSTPLNGTQGVDVASGIGLDVYLPNDAVDGATLTADSVRLIRLRDGAQLPANLNTTGGGDAIVLQPQTAMLPETPHLLMVTEEVRDLSGVAFVPYRIFFVTAGGDGDTGESVVRFDRTVVAEGLPFTSLLLGPDGRLYASTVDGRLARFPLNEDGTLGSAEVINTVLAANGNEPRVILGLAFDPAATADDLLLWISHGAPIASGGGAPAWTSRISQLSGPNLDVIQDYVVNLPRSFRNHMTNGIAFGPDGLLYALQGANASMGAPDNTWGLRPERLLSGAVLRIDLAAIANPPLDVKTEAGGRYDPFAAEVPLTIYATGVRNPYDLVWHSNGALYTGNNGSAAGGNTPETPDPLPTACQRARMDGGYDGPAVPPLTNVATAQNDYLFRVEAGGYYGHPNPLRCEWVLNGGNPTAGVDVAEVAQYPVGTLPDPNWRTFAYDFGVHFSPNGLIEYQNDAFDGYLTGKLLVIRYSRGDDVIVLTPGLPDWDIVSAETGLPGLTGFQDPLDLVENPSNGHLYVVEFAPPSVQRISLLRPLQDSGNDNDSVPTVVATATMMGMDVPIATEMVVTPTTRVMAEPTVVAATTAVAAEVVVTTAVVPTVIVTPTARPVLDVAADESGADFGMGVVVGVMVALLLVGGLWLIRR